MQRNIYLTVILAFLLIGCNSAVDSTTQSTPDENPPVDSPVDLPVETPANLGGWLVPQSEVYDGGPGKDGIPALESPEFISSSEVDYIELNELILAVKFGDVIKVYPHSILDWHEIVNDEVGGYKLALSYCPLTGSGIGWYRVVNGETTTFGVSGLIYNSNLIPYDRKTNSNWSQMLQQSINGVHYERNIVQYPNQIIETTWRTWSSMYSDALVLSPNTGHSRPYGQYPYGDYRSNHSSLLFPVSVSDSRLARKERVLGVKVNNESKAYKIAFFNHDLSLINDNLGGEDIVVIGSSGKNVAMAYKRMLGGQTLEFQVVENSLPVIMTDNEGSTWDIWGEAINGPRIGSKLNTASNHIAYWFAWAAFHPGTLLGSL